MAAQVQHVLISTCVNSDCADTAVSKCPAPILLQRNVINQFLEISSRVIYDISAQQNRHRSKLAQKKNELTLLYSAMIKKKSCAKLIVLHLMVTRYIGNMIAFLRCHYAYLSITITSKLAALNHNKILYYCNCQATISSSIYTFAIFFRKL